MTLRRMSQEGLVYSTGRHELHSLVRERETPATLYRVVVSSIAIFSGHWKNGYKGDESFWQLLQKENIWDLNRKHCRIREGEAKLMKSATVLTRTAREGWG